MESDDDDDDDILYTTLTVMLNQHCYCILCHGRAITGTEK